MFTPEQVQPHPSAAKKKKKNRMLQGRKEGRTKVLTDTSVKAKIEVASPTRKVKKRQKRKKLKHKKQRSRL